MVNRLNSKGIIIIKKIKKGMEKPDMDFKTDHRYGTRDTVPCTNTWCSKNGSCSPNHLGEYATASPQSVLIEYNDVWKSTDGINWERIVIEAPWEPRVYHNLVSYNGVMYLIAGGNNHLLKNDVWKSSDGIHWEQVKHSFWTKRHAQSVVGYKGKLFMTGGNPGNYVNEVWTMDITN